MGNLKVGTAKINITPPLGCRMAGYAARDRGSEAIADELYSKALVFDDGETMAAILTNDLIGLDSGFVDRVRLMIESATGIPAENVMISCSHTHFGPEVRKPRLDLPADESPNRVYADILAQKLATVTQLAQQGVQPAKVGAGQGVVDQVNYNRHTILPNGKAVTSFRRPTPDSDLTFGPYDPTLRVLRVDNSAENPIASLIHFACHPVTTTDRMYTISADYPGYAMGVVERESGLCLFGLGCAGNIVPIQREGKFPRMIGTSIGGEAIKTLPWIETTDELKLNIAHRKLSLERKEAVNGKMSEEIDLQCIGIGAISLIGLPGEIFIEIGFDIVNRSRRENLFVMSMTNGSIGYIPITVAYEQGGYESNSSRFRPGCGEQIADAAVELLNRME